MSAPSRRNRSAGTSPYDSGITAESSLSGFLWRHKGKMLATFFAVSALVVAYLSLAPRRFQSEAKLFIRLGREAVNLDPTATTGHLANVADSRESEILAVEELLVSRTAAERIVERFGTHAILEKATRGGLSLSQRLAWLDDYNLNPLRVYSLHDKAIEKVRTSLGVSAGRKSSVLTVSYESNNPRLAHDVLEALVQSARDDHLRIHETPGSQEFFESQRDLLRTNVAQLEEQLRGLKDRTGLAELAKQREIEIELIGTLRADLLRAETEHAAGEAEIALRQGQFSKQPALVVTEQTTGQPQTARQALREKLYELEIREKELAARLKEDVPQLTQIRQQIAEAGRIMSDEQIVTQVTQGANPTYQATELALQERLAQNGALAARQKSLTSKISAAQENLKQLNAAEVELTRLEREVELARSNYRKYSEHLEQTRIDQELAQAKISSLNVMQPPTLSVTPISPQPLPTLAFGVVTAALSALGVALWSDRRNRIRDAGPITTSLPTLDARVEGRRRRSPVAPASPR